MKKIKVIVLLLILTLIAPINIQADMGAPQTNYKVRVNNPEGIYAYKWTSNGSKYEKTSTILKYDTVVTVSYEEIVDGILYGHAYNESKDEQVIIKLSETTPVEVKLSDYKKDNKVKYYVFDETCYLYKGPSKRYGKVETNAKLDVDTIIETEYYDEVWIYVEQNGVKGWAYAYSYSYNDEPAGMVKIDANRNAEIKTIKEVEMYKSPKTDESLGVTIPVGIEIETIYNYSKQPREPYYYVKYNDTYGWIKVSKESSIQNDGIVTNIMYKQNKEIEITNVNGVSLYPNFNTDKNEITVIPYGTKLQSYYYVSCDHSAPWSQIEYNGKSGWINENDLYTYEENENSEILNPDTEDEQENDEATNDKTEKKDINVNTIILYCVATAIIISLTAIVTTILINKKIKNKNKEKV